MVALSIVMGPVRPISGAIEYEVIPPPMRGRIFGLLGSAFVGAAPVGAIGAGLLVEAIGLQTALLTGALRYACVTLIPRFTRVAAP